MGSTVDFPSLEKDAKCTIRTAKAYSSKEDKRALWPYKNFARVVREHLAKAPTDCLVMSAPTVDITNIDTAKLRQSDSTDVYQQMVHVSCVNMFTCAEYALKDYPNLKKVILLEHAPRYDTEDVDPLGLKSALAKYANNTFSQLWLNSKEKNRIMIGQHNLSTGGSGANHDDWFRNINSSKYDGVHFYGYSGRKNYRRSLLNIFQKAFGPIVQQPQDAHKESQNVHKQSQNVHKQSQNTPHHNQNSSQYLDSHQSCPQAQYQQRQKKSFKKPRFTPSVQVQNRFSVFNSNQGNL